MNWAHLNGQLGPSPTQTWTRAHQTLGWVSDTWQQPQSHFQNLWIFGSNKLLPPYIMTIEESIPKHIHGRTQNTHPQSDLVSFFTSHEPSCRVLLIKRDICCAGKGDWIRFNSKSIKYTWLEGFKDIIIWLFMFGNSLYFMLRGRGYSKWEDLGEPV